MGDFSGGGMDSRSVIVHLIGIGSDSVIFATSLLAQQVIVPYLLIQHRFVLSTLLLFKYSLTVISWKNH